MVSPTEPLEVKSWAYTKGVLHAFVVVFSIVALGLTFGLIGHGTLGSITTYSIPGVRLPDPAFVDDFANMCSPLLPFCGVVLSWWLVV
jgi:hypothetical protein